ncbi:MAG: Energy-coupling factor transporter transmembrane protein EcfT [Syntrophomonadaceae bacterium]|nr:Energy-coupling factor transporter transmembrane protein EcfT [Bacillota bacterium]MBT9147853.1 Energy-coupling factor transporter transmembrane protein EcfT [Bacillota bacterium]
MSLFMYIEKNTFIHRLDHRTKLLTLLCSLASAIMMTHPLSGLAVTGLVLVWGLLARSLGNLKRVRGIMFTIFTMSVVMWSLFTREGEVLFLFVTIDGVLLGLSSGIRIVTMIISGLIFLSTTRVEEIALGLVKLGLPYQVGFAFSSAIRLVPTFIGVGATISQAQRSRGLNLETGGFTERIRKYIPLLVPIFLSAIRNTDQLARALESKGFGARPKRTFYRLIKFGPADYAVAVFFLSVVGAVIWLSINGYGKSA